MRNSVFRARGIFIAIVLGLTFVAPGAPTSGQTQDAFVASEVVVKLVEPADPIALAAAYGLTIVDQFGLRSIYRLRIGDGSTPPQKVQQLLTDARVQYAELNYIGQTPEGRQRTSWAIGGDAGGYQAQWAAPKLRLPEAHITSTGEDVVVAVLDTGADLDHPQLQERWLEADGRVVGYDFVDGDADPSEEGLKDVNYGFGHGTHVAGLVALSAPGAKIMPLRVLDENGAGDVWVLAEALAWAVANGADVVNLSLSTTRRASLLDEIIAEITCDCDGRRGVVVVAAAGNDGDGVLQYPAAGPHGGMIAVAASTATDALAAFSTRGDWVDLMAPGERILSTVPGGAYGTWSGTSMAAPLVAGSAALKRSLCPSMDAFSLATRVVQSSADAGGPVWRRADAAATLQVGCSLATSKPPGEYRCSGAVGAVKLDNVVVPPGKTCTLDGTRAGGTIKVGANATLIARRVRVNGNIQADGARLVVLHRGTALGGNLQIKAGGAVTIEAVSIHGDLQVAEQRGILRVAGNTVGGNVQVVKNSAGLALVSNWIAGNLQCKENTPPPTGGNNSAASKEDQCARL